MEAKQPPTAFARVLREHRLAVEAVEALEERGGDEKLLMDWVDEVQAAADGVRRANKVGRNAAKQVREGGCSGLGVFACENSFHSYFCSSPRRPPTRCPAWRRSRPRSSASV